MPTTYLTKPEVTNASGDRLLDKNECAALLGVSKRSVENLQAQGLPHIKLGVRRCRYIAGDVLAWVRQFSVSRRAPARVAATAAVSR